MVSIDISQETLTQLETLAKLSEVSVTQFLDDMLQQQSITQLNNAIVEKSKDAMLVINADNKYIAVNDAACDLLGYSRDELLTLKAEDIIAEDDTRHQKVKETWQSQNYADSIYRLRKKDGSYVFVGIVAVANVIEGQHLAIMRDATEQVNLIRALTESKQSVKTIFADTETPIFSLAISEDAEFTYHELSNAYLQTFNHEHDTLINKNLHDIETLPHTYLSGLREYAQKCFASGRPLRYQIAFPFDEKVIVLLTHLSPLRDDDGRIYRIMGMCLDMSDKIAYEEEQLRAYLLHSELSKAQELNRYKAEVTAMLAHEFQSPLSVINTSLYMLEKTPKEGFLEQRLIQIMRQVNLLQQLMQRIIDLNEGAMMEQDLDLTEINFPRFVQAIIDDLTTSFPDDSRLNFTHNIPKPIISTDAELMRQIVTNLLTNALKYSAEQKLPIQIKCVSDTRQFSVIVEDQGIGIPQDDLETIFEFFKRGRNVQQQQGIGIGLMVVKQAVHRLGGKVDIASKEGQGTTVTVSFPVGAVYPNHSF